jgi:hypothetical protein
VRSLYRAGALGLVSSELDRCRMDLVEVQEVRWEGSGTRTMSIFYKIKNKFCCFWNDVNLSQNKK